MKTQPPTLLAQALQDFFGNYLPQLRGMSPHTIASYRDSLVLLLRFIAVQKKLSVQHFDFPEISTAEVLAFLAYLEKERHNGATTRNVRLAAIHAFFRYLAGRHPDQLEYCQRMLGIPFKRARTRTIEYLEYEEIQQLLSCIDQSTLGGQRDYVLLASLFNTGARVQEILDLRAKDLRLTKPYQLRLFGKGRKERFCPLWPQTARVLRFFCTRRHIDLSSEERIFVNHRGEPLTRFGVRYILKKHKMNRPSPRWSRLRPRFRRDVKIPGESLQIDVKCVPKRLAGRRRFYQFTAIDEATCPRVLRLYDHNTAKNTIAFFEEAQSVLPRAMRRLQTDHGLEFG